MVRFKIDTESTERLDRITSIYNFKRDSITGRIALALSIEKGKIFPENSENLPANGREYTPTSNIFGRLISDVDNFIIYKILLDQHYNKELSESEFIKMFKLHLHHGLQLWERNLVKGDISRGDHISLLLQPIKRGLLLRSNIVQTATEHINQSKTEEFSSPLSFILGQTEEGENIEIKINDLREFDNRNIAIAGMAGSGKTQLVKDILFQISKNSDRNLKFIFFDYKGEGNQEQLSSFLSETGCEFVDIVKDGGLKFNPFHAINMEERQRPFSIKAFVETIATFVPSVGVTQKNILTNIISDLFEDKKGLYPTVTELFQRLENYYEENNRKADTLFAGIQDLSTNIFNSSSENPNILNQSLYLNLPPALSDTLRQLVVFLLLRYFNTFFSSANDVEPTNYIIPLRYIIVIDEAHIYLKNKNARKALEELLRLLRSKGVIIILISQGVEDYKTKDFDFASQVKLPICLNVQNKDYKSISNFVGTPTSKYKLENEIKKLKSGFGLINLSEPKILKLRQFWQTVQENQI